MKIGEVYSDFILLDIIPVEEISANVHIFCHQKTGARLLYTGREDANKTFAVAFETVPENDTGVFHILEHSVLCGSDRFPVREPFVELLKGSMNTFLNAMTFPDKTVYPVASRNDADFRNLMRVYLDAVFCPAIYHNENIFRQEGWHFEVDEKGEAHHVGVVFGEMTGAFSSVDETIQTELLRSLFPDSNYGFVSGGDPAHIPELTYEEFLDNHKRFYHPSNAKLFLDGTVDIADILEEIDREYLSKYCKRLPDFAIRPQRELPYREKTVQYAVSENKPDQAHFVLGRLVGTWEDREKNAALAILMDALAGTNSAPMTRAVLERGLGKDLLVQVDDSMAQSFLMLQVRNTGEEKLPGMKAEIQTIVREILDRGIDRQELIASLNRAEFGARERQEPYGVHLAIAILQSWLYGGDPTANLRVGALFASLREKLDSTYYEDLLRETFLQNAGMKVLFVQPSETLAAELAERERVQIEHTYGKFSEAEKAAVAQACESLSRWQQTPDSREALDTIPHLSVSDIPEMPLMTPVQETAVDGVRVLHPELKTGGTVYADFYFALPDMTLETLPQAVLMTELLTQLPTDIHTAPMLQRAIKTNLGSMSFSIEVFSRPGETDLFTPYLRASFSVLEEKLETATELLSEVLTRTQTDHPDKVREIVEQTVMDLQQGIIMSGHVFAMRRATATHSAECLAAEYAGGYTFYDWLRGVAGNFDRAFPALRQSFEKILGSLCTAELTVCGNISDVQIRRFCSALPVGEKRNTAVRVTEHNSRKEAILIPAGIGYAVRAANVYREVPGRTGSMALMSKLLSLDYLWNEVRVQGGAYGAGMNVAVSGAVFCYSFRDPNPARTLKIYDKAASYLKKCCEEGRKLDQLIIGAVSDSEPLQNATGENRLAAARVLRGITPEDRLAERKELLHTTHEDLLRCSALLEKLMEDSSVCVVAGEPLADACEITFDERLRG